ncbi:Uncharacterized membrane protein [Marininema mesophilum]|uniref:Uncharacterized membrane protein n=1 Tax=Marininema mesophilum TaxID=1048340 RepID=A0A1H2YUC4_9BACL|nr:DUF1700 domain-containing protein [Marininema mesophilum]SDX08647.1 Uncharacterized membrane protein [Marininema mesophilum]
MMKDEFLKKLRSHLVKIPEKEKQEILSDYVEHFQHGFHKGRTEEEMVRTLGDPRKIARELIADYHLERAQENQSFVSLFRATFTFLGLGFFNLVFMLGPLIIVLSVIFSMYVTSLILLITPLFAIEALLMESSLLEFLLRLLTSLIGAGVGLLLGMGTVRFSRTFFGWFIRYLKSNLNIIKGVNKHA